MKNITKNISFCFAAGSLGGLSNSIVVWLFGLLGITTVLGVNISPKLTPAWLYPRIVWGGLWGMLFLLPYFKNSFLIKGIFCSFFPSIVQLIVVFPFKADKGFFGFALGNLTPLFVLLFNIVWGLTAISIMRMVKDTSNDI